MMMGILDKLNDNPALGAAIAVVAVLAVSVEIYHFASVPSKQQIDFAAVRAAAPAYFTTDDGNSTFIDAGTNVAPFDHDGRQAVKAYVYFINGKQVVKYLEQTSGGALQVKKPGGAWIPDSDPKAAVIRDVKDPSGAPLTPVTPPND
jgi:hypothetical protein